MINNHQLLVKQVKQAGKVTGYLTLNHYEYGYSVQLHIFSIPGYIENKCFPTREKATGFFNRIFETYNK